MNMEIRKPIPAVAHFPRFPPSAVFSYIHNVPCACTRLPKPCVALPVPQFLLPLLRRLRLPVLE